MSRRPRGKPTAKSRRTFWLRGNTSSVHLRLAKVDARTKALGDRLGQAYFVGLTDPDRLVFGCACDPEVGLIEARGSTYDIIEQRLEQLIHEARHTATVHHLGKLHAREVARLLEHAAEGTLDDGSPWFVRLGADVVGCCVSNPQRTDLSWGWSTSPQWAEALARREKERN